MYKATYKTVKDLIKWGQDDEAIKAMYDAGYQPQGHIFASYWPSGANWAYQIGLYRINGELYELVTRFGAVEGGRRIYEVELQFKAKEVS